jgi:uncharacterized SAM-binding protein YcdF (DUF218 family)
MNPAFSPRRSRWIPILAIAAAVVAIVAASPVRTIVLRAAGWALVINEPLAPADIIVISLDSGGAGVLETADLVQRGIAKKVAVFSAPLGREGDEFIRRGVPYEDEGARQIGQLQLLGVTDVMRISITERGTEAEARALPAWGDQHGFRSIVLVTARDHSRRMRRVLNRLVKPHSWHVTVQASHYSSFDPDQWWETRSGIRTEISELQKLLLEVILHPLSF